MQTSRRPAGPGPVSASLGPARRAPLPRPPDVDVPWSPAQRRTALGWALALSLPLAVALLWSAGRRLSADLLGIPHFDSYGTWWFYWYTEQVFRGEASAVHTDLFFYPWGKDIYGDTGANLLDAAGAMPFRFLLGAVAGYNAFVLFGIVAGAAGIALCARALTRDPVAVAAAFALGLASPYAWFELSEGRPTQALLLFPALTLAALLRLPRTTGWTLPVLGALALALTGLQYWYYAIFGGMAVVAHGLVTSLGRERRAAVANLLRHGAMAGLSLVFVLPAVLPMLRAVGTGEVNGILDVGRWTLWHQEFVTVAGDLIAPYLWQPLDGAAGSLVRHQSGLELFLGNAAWTPALLGLVAALGLVRLGHRGRGPAAILAVALVIGFGPVVVVAGWMLPNPVYIGLAKVVPVFARLWWPARAYVEFAILLPCLAAVALPLLGRWRGLGAALLLGSVAWHQHGRDLLPFPHWTPQVTAADRCLALGPPGAIIALPDAYAQENLLGQTVHQRPTFGGMNDMLAPPEYREVQEGNSFLAALDRLTSGLRPAPLRFKPEDKEEMIQLGYRYVVMSWPGLDEAKSIRRDANALRIGVRNVMRESMGSPVYRDAQTSIWDLHGKTSSPCEGADIPPDESFLDSPGPNTSTLVDREHMHRYLRRLGDPPPEPPKTFQPGERPPDPTKPGADPSGDAPRMRPPGRPRGK